MKVYDILGREVATLVDEYKPAGNYEIEFDVRSYGGSKLLFASSLATVYRPIIKLISPAVI